MKKENFNSTNVTNGMDITIPNGYNTLMNGDSELENLEKRKKEIMVKKVHKNKICDPTEKYPYYKTRIPGDKQITAKEYYDVINELYNLYFGNKVHIPSLREAVEGWISTRLEKKTIEYLTAVHYRADFNKYISDLPIADMPISDITESILMSAYESIVGDGSSMFKKALNNVKTIINGAFDYANMMDGVTCIDARRVRITDLIRKCKAPASEGETYTREEAETLINYLETQEPNVFNLSVRLMFCLPVRIGEIRAIAWNDYNKAKKELYLTHSLVTKQVGNINRCVTDVDYMKAHSNKGKRIIPLSDYAIHLLDELEKLNGDKNYILQSQGEKPISVNAFNEHLRDYCNACGIKYKSSHKIRFYACSQMYDAEMDEKTIQEFMGHSSLAMTRHYDRRAKKDISRDVLNNTLGFNMP